MAKPGSTATRIRNDLLSDIRLLLDKAGNSMSSTAAIESVLQEALAQIKSAAAPAHPLPFVSMLRAQLGKVASAPASGDLAERVMAHEKKIDTMSELLARLTAAAEEHTAASESSKTKQAARRKPAA